MFTLIISCVSCCVRSARRRQALQYTRIVQTHQPGYGTTQVITNYPTGVVSPPVYTEPVRPAMAPPAYVAKEEQPPQYHI